MNRIHRIVGIAMFVMLNWGCNKGLVNNNCIEKINPDCFCTMHYDPVCGCNNKTYGNACMASCSGITEYVEGECP